jgi:pilus assembly protein FimV
VAKLNPKKVKEDADKEERAGRYEKAIDLLKQLVSENPGDWNTINKIGDLYAKGNNTRAANEHYARVAHIQAKEGFYLKSIALWKKIQKNDPNDLAPYQNLADLYVKQGLLVDAKAQLQTVVDEYIKRGRAREAGDALKRMADIDPSDLKVRSKLADLYMRDGNSAKAVEEHVAIAEELGKKGHLAEAVQVLEKGLKLDPRSGRMRAELARVHLLQKNYERAVQVLEEATRQGSADKEVYVRLGEAYLGARRIQDAEGALRRVLQQDPQDQDARTQMGRVFLMQGRSDEAFDQFLPIVERMMERKDGERAAGVLQQIVQRSPGHIKSLAKLVEVYRQLRKDMLVNQTYSQMVEAFMNQGQLDQAASILDILVGLEPHNDQHRSKLEFVRSKLKGGGGRAAATAPSGTSATGVEEDFELGGIDEAPALSFDASVTARGGGGRVPGRPTIELSPPLSGDDSEFISEHLAEGRVFRKYGLADKARDQFDAITSRFPDHMEARQELREVYKEKGENEKAAEQCLAMAEICRLKGDSASEAKWQAEAMQLFPQPAPAPAPAPAPIPVPPVAAAPAVLSLAEPEPLGAPLEEVEEAEEEIPLEVEEAGLEEAALETEPGDELQIDIGTEQEADAGEGLGDQFVEEEVVPAPTDFEAEVEALAEDAITQKLEAPVVPPAPPPAPSPRPAPAPSKVTPAKAPPPPKAAPAPPPASKPSRITPKPAAPPPPPPSRKAPLVAKAVPAPAPANGGVPPELQRILDEVESYVSLGFVDDAKEALGEIDPQFADHPALVQKLAELGLEVGAPAPKPAPAKPAAAKAPAAPAKPVPPPKPAVPPRPLAIEKAKLVPPPPSRPAPPPPLEADFDMGSLVEEPALEEALLDDAAIGEPVIDEAPMEEPAIDDGLELEEPSAAEGEPSPLDDAFGELGLGEPTPPPVPEGPALESGGIDLGDELGDLFGAQAAVAEEPPPQDGTDLGDAGLADIFKEFKKGVDKQLGKEDYDTRYNLGIAYKEMGLIDEAIAEFQLAAKDENRLLECASMLGICFMEKGMPKLAVKWFEKGLAAPGRGEEEYQGIRYDLAVAYEASGDTDRALGIFTELYGQDANFRDVASKVRDLRAALK